MENTNQAIKYITTKHAEVRIKERLGLPKKAVKRQFQLAVERNRYSEMPHSVITWLQSAIKERQAGFMGTKEVAVYNKRAFVYGVNGDERVLITILETPAEFKQYM